MFVRLLVLPRLLVQRSVESVFAVEHPAIEGEEYEAGCQLVGRLACLGKIEIPLQAGRRNALSSFSLLIAY